jgi:hypothetical protein
MKLQELHRVTQVKVTGLLRLGLIFDDGTYKEVNLKPWLEQRPLGVFEPLLDPAFFAQAKVDPLLGTVVWPNGADFCPDVLYAYPEPVEVEVTELQAGSHSVAVAS